MQNEAITHVGIDMGMRNRVTACTTMSGARFFLNSGTGYFSDFSVKIQNIYFVKTAHNGASNRICILKAPTMSGLFRYQAALAPQTAHHRYLKQNHEPH